MVGNDFSPPNRKRLGGTLLDINAERTSKASCNEKIKVADLWGLTFIGDFATIGRMPLLNILVLCGDLPPSVLAIKECTEQLVKGGKKDASYVASEFGEEVEKMDRTGTYADFFWFDGASNVQKAGEILTVKHPHAACYPGFEHNVSRVFYLFSRIPGIRVSWAVAVAHNFHDRC